MSKKIGLTVLDLLLNPALFHSPQFKRLPLEQQFKLATAYKQYMMIHRPEFYINGNPTTVQGYDFKDLDIKIP